MEGLNSFETGTITANDLVNKSEYDGEGFGISGGYGYQNDGPNNPKGTNSTQTETVNLPDGSHSVNKNVGIGKDKESDSSITQSGIGTGNIKVTDNEKQKELTGQTAEEAAKGIESALTTETVADNSGAIENIFDKEKDINGIENFWNQAKRHMRKFNGIPKDHFELYLKEYEWRFNNSGYQNQLKQLKHLVREFMD